MLWKNAVLKPLMRLVAITGKAALINALLVDMALALLRPIAPNRLEDRPLKAVAVKLTAAVLDKPDKSCEALLVGMEVSSALVKPAALVPKAATALAFCDKACSSKVFKLAMAKVFKAATKLAPVALPMVDEPNKLVVKPTTLVPRAATWVVLKPLTTLLLNWLSLALFKPARSVLVMRPKLLVVVLRP